MHDGLVVNVVCVCVCACVYVCMCGVSTVHVLVHSDHTITLVDIRKFSQPLRVMKGHRKAVSYVHYLPEDELLVSA